MPNALIIARRELGAYFNSLVAYAVVILFLVITGALFWQTYFNEVSLLSMRGYFDQAPLMLAFFAPALTMGLFATEERSGTLQWLMTMPLTSRDIVLGKFLAAMALFLVVFAMTLPYPYTLSLIGELDWGAVATGYLGMTLLAGTYAAIGLMASSFTRDQVVAILLAFTLCFFLYLIDILIAQPSGAWTRTLEYASTNYHFQNLARGVIDLQSIIYYVSLTAAALVITTLRLESRRWN